MVGADTLCFGTDAHPNRTRQQVNIRATFRNREIGEKSCRYASPGKDRVARDGNIENGNEFDSGSRPCGLLAALGPPLVATRMTGRCNREARGH
jgi:hypothetical protein